jgi:pimeloyl-ACP methyl ester carboxylesterase
VPLGAGDHDLLIGGQAAVVSVPERPNGRLVLYVHGYDAPHTAVLDDDALGGLAGGLVTAGYVVAAGHAGGNAWGNDASVDAYAELAAVATDLVDAAQVFLVAESMGGLAAARLVADRRIEGLRAYAGIYPLCDLSSVYADFADSVDEAYGPGVEEALARLSPVPLDGDVPVLFWASVEDTTVDKVRNADVCAAQVLDDGGRAVVVETEGDHLDPSNFDLEAMLSFFESAAG